MPVQPFASLSMVLFAFFVSLFALLLLRITLYLVWELPFFLNLAILQK